MWFKEAHVIVLVPHGSQHLVATKVSRIASWVSVCSLPWTQHMRWIPIGLMGCVHTHQGMLTIEVWGNLSCVWSDVEKIKENNRKARKIGWVVSQAPALKLEYDKMWTRWALDISLENMLKKYDGVDTLKWNLEVEPFVVRWVVQMKKDTRAKGGRRSHVAMRCYWKRNVLLSIRAKVWKRKGCWSAINLTSMIEMTRPNSLNKLLGRWWMSIWT
jgi:hypothetical protein